jgi:hypothetical protein
VAGARRQRRPQLRRPACGAPAPSTSARAGERARRTRRRRGRRRTRGGGRSTRGTSPQATRWEHRSGRRAAGRVAGGRRDRPGTAALPRRRRRRSARAGSDLEASRHTTLTSQCPRLEGHRTSVETKASRVGDGFVTNVCRIQPGDEKARSASASVSLDPTSNHRPGTRQAYTGTRGYSHSTNRPGWSGLFPPSMYSRTRPNDERG